MWRCDRTNFLALLGGACVTASFVLVAACSGDSPMASASSSSSSSSSSGGSSGTSGSSGSDASNDATGFAENPGTVSLIAGGAATQMDGVGAAAGLGSPTAIAYDGVNNVYVADLLLRIVKVDLTTTAATTIPGSHHASAVAVDATANVLYYMDALDAELVAYDIASETTTVVAGALEQKSAVDAVGTAARFLAPGRLTVANGKVYITDACAIRSFDIATAAVTTVAGSATECGNVDGPLLSARFGSASFGPSQGGPLGLVMGTSQTLFVADRNNNVIRAVHLDTGTTELVAGSGYGSGDGVFDHASFQEVKDVAWDAARARLYVAGTGGTIRQIALADHYADNVVTTVAGTWPGEQPFAPGRPGSLTRPSAVAVVGSDVIGGDLAVLFRVTGL